MSDPQLARVTWRELRQHAAFPAALTTVEPERIRTPLGELDCLRYEDGTSTFRLAPAHPGMPARCRSGGALVEVVAID